MRNQIIQGDCLEILKSLPDNSLDSCVVDPPYGLGEVKDIAGLLQAWMNDLDDSKYVGKSGFMNAQWDSCIPGPRYWKEVIRCLKPGAHILAFAGTRTYDLLVIALRLAGFQVRDQIEWVYGSGMPKSLAIDKAIDKMKGAEREVVGQKIRLGDKKPYPYDLSGSSEGWHRPFMDTPEGNERYGRITAPATPEAQQWAGWGSGLKPSHEPICLARKPLAEDTIAANILEYGVGGLNIDASRINPGEHVPGGGNGKAHNIKIFSGETKGERPIVQPHTNGRFPANFLMSHTLYCQPNGLRKVKANVLQSRKDTPTTTGIYGKYSNGRSQVSHGDSEGEETVEDYICTPDCPVRLLDEQSGIRETHSMGQKYAQAYGEGQEIPRKSIFGNTKHHGQPVLESSSGGASRYFMRFFYSPKSSKSERNLGCEGLPEKYYDVYGDDEWGKRERNVKPATNHHPTVKPISLMRYLVRMITPPGGIVLDCFGGSGTTALACIAEGFDYLIIEQSSEYCAIAEARVQHALKAAGQERTQEPHGGEWDCVPECPVRMLGEMSGERKSGGRIAKAGDERKNVNYYAMTPRANDFAMEASDGTAARYFMQFAPDSEEPEVV